MTCYMKNNKEVIQPQVPLTELREDFLSSQVFYLLVHLSTLRLPCLSDSETPICNCTCSTTDIYHSACAVILPVSQSYDLAHLAEL